MTDAKEVKTRTLAMMAEIDPYELTCRITEAITRSRRPVGMTAKQAIETQPPEFQVDVMEAARRAAEYIVECINAGRAPS